jgi:hypothetical protein
VILKVAVQIQSPGNVFGLRCLASSTKQQEQLFSSKGVVHPVTGAHIDPQFSDTLCEIAMVAWVAMDQTIDAHQDARSAG